MLIFITEFLYSVKGHLFTVSSGCTGGPAPFIQVEISIKIKNPVTWGRYKSGSAVVEIKQILDFKALLRFDSVIPQPQLGQVHILTHM